MVRASMPSYTTSVQMKISISIEKLFCAATSDYIETYCFIVATLHYFLIEYKLIALP